MKSSLNRPAYFAERIRDAMSGAGTRDSDLIRLIVSRAEYDLANIKQEYLRRYGHALEKDISVSAPPAARTGEGGGRS